MKNKLILSLMLGATLVACSPSDDAATSQPTQESTTYSAEKQKYVQPCLGTPEEDFCSCQFDVMNPILSKSIGSDWSEKGMEEDDFAKYFAAVEEAVSQCS